MTTGDIINDGFITNIAKSDGERILKIGKYLANYGQDLKVAHFDSQWTRICFMGHPV